MCSWTKIRRSIHRWFVKKGPVNCIRPNSHYNSVIWNVWKSWFTSSTKSHLCVCPARYFISHSICSFSNLFGRSKSQANRKSSQKVAIADDVSRRRGSLPREFEAWRRASSSRRSSSPIALPNLPIWHDGLWKQTSHSYSQASPLCLSGHHACLREGWGLLLCFWVSSVSESGFLNKHFSDE